MITGKCFIHALFGFERIAHVIPCVRKIRLYADGFPISHNGFIKFIPKFEGSAKIRIIMRIIRRNLNCPADKPDCFIVFFIAMCQNPQQMKGFGMIGLRGKNLPITGLSRLQFTGLLIGKSLMKKT